MAYKIVFSKKAEKELSKLPAQLADEIADEIEQLAENPRPFGYKKLTKFTVPNVSSDLYRIRISDYRVVYAIEDNVLTIYVFKIAHRSKVYE